MDNDGTLTPASRFPGIWARPLAVLLDVAILRLAGLALGALPESWFLLLGRRGPLLGLAIVLCYFGFLGSRLTGGRTPGKMVLRIRVCDLAGQPLSIPRSWLRALALVLPFFVIAGMPGNFLLALAGGNSFSLLTALVVVAQAYLFLFHLPGRRSVHDLLASSSVVRASAAEPETAPALSPRSRAILFGVIGVLAMSGHLLDGALSRARPGLPVLARFRDDARKAGLLGISCRQGGVSVPGGSRGSRPRTMDVELYFSRDLQDMAEARRLLVPLGSSLLSADPGLASYDRCGIDVYYGYSIGIQSRFHKSTYCWSCRRDSLPHN